MSKKRAANRAAQKELFENLDEVIVKVKPSGLQAPTSAYFTEQFSEMRSSFGNTSDIIISENDNSSIEYSSSSLSSDDDLYISTLEGDLVIFQNIYNVSRNGMQFLLNILNNHNVKVAPTTYLLNKKSKENLISVKTNELENGNFSYFSIKENIEFCLNKKLLDKPADKRMVFNKVYFNSDGLP